MAPIKSNSPFASYFDFFSKSGLDAVNPVPPPGPAAVEASGGTKINYNDVNYHVFTGTAPFSTPADFDTNINYVILGGGGGAGYSSPNGNGGPGGGGAGAVIDKSNVPISGAIDVTVTVGNGGAKASSVNTLGSDGGDSSINFPGGTLTAEGGGAGGRAEVPQASGSPYESGGPGRNGGSGGGAGLYYPKTGGTASGAPFPGTPGNSPDAGWGHVGGRGGDPGNPQNPFYYAGGGGGAGGVGEAGGDGSNASGGTGGLGYLLPTNFQLPAPTMAPNPYGDPGPSGGAYWVAGGGASGMYYHPPDTPTTATQAAARGGGASHGPGAAGFAGAGNGVVSSTSGIHYGDHTDALANSGSGGGGGGGDGSSGGPGDGGSGGSGLVLISYAYPS
jgi:hypothetical protein